MDSPDDNRPRLPSLLTRASLLLRLKNPRDGTAWTEFFDLYHGYVYRHARGSGLSHHEAEDVAQEVFKAVVVQIEQFDLRPRTGSFRRWLGNQTRWRVADRFRERARSPADPSHGAVADPEAIERLASPTAEVERMEADWRAQLAETALQRLASKVKPQHFQVFVLHYRDHWPLKRIATELGLSFTSTYVIHHRLLHRLRSEVAELARALGD